MTATWRKRTRHTLFRTRKIIAGDTTEISVHYDSFTFTISVGGTAETTSIKVTEVPARTVYVEGEFFNTSGLIVSSCLEDGSVYKGNNRL